MFYSVPKYFQKLFPTLEWHIQERERCIYITFDDGPHPNITHKVLDILEEYNAKATFFCVGENAGKYPETFERLISENHVVGNHTQNHVSGWSTAHDLYISNVLTAKKIISSDLFRPPYGRLRRRQRKSLQRNFRIIMWDVLSCDYEKNLDRKSALEKIVKQTQPGSIIVFHDSEKAGHNMLYLLPRYLKIMQQRGYVFKSIPQA